MSKLQDFKGHITMLLELRVTWLDMLICW